jgi:hypothetical protein
MNENRRQILEMLAAGKITADEAERLLSAIEPGSAPAVLESMGRAGSATAGGGEVLQAKARSKYLRVLVEADESMTGIKGATTVNVRVPLQFLRAGVRLASLIPSQAQRSLHQARRAGHALADQAGKPRGTDRPSRRPDSGRGRQ